MDRFSEDNQAFRKDGFCHRHDLTEGAVGVVTQALVIGNGHEKEIERRCFLTQVLNAVFTDQWEEGSTGEKKHFHAVIRTLSVRRSQWAE
jgi:predicted Zn-dependent protease